VDYKAALYLQRDRLAIAAWLRGQAESDHDCPVCGNQMHRQEERLEALLRSLEEIENSAMQFQTAPVFAAGRVRLVVWPALVLVSVALSVWLLQSQQHSNEQLQALQLKLDLHFRGIDHEKPFVRIVNAASAQRFGAEGSIRARPARTGKKGAPLQISEPRGKTITFRLSATGLKPGLL